MRAGRTRTIVAQMSTATTIHEIATLIASRHPVIALESVEEDRVREIVLSAALRVDLPVFEWSVTQGLRPTGQRDQINGLTSAADKMLAHVTGMTVRAVFLTLDLAPHLESPVNRRLTRELVAHLRERGSSLVITGSGIELPQDVEREAVQLRISLPDRDELSAVLDAVSQSMRVPVGQDTRAAALAALQGLTLNQARQAVAARMVDGAFTVDDVTHLMDEKVRAISEGGLLEYFPPTDNVARLAGMANLRAWLERADVAATPQAKALNITPPRGILLAGVPGCGKSLAARYIARRWGRPLLKLDAGALYDKYVGESERNLRTALSMAESLAPVVLWIDEIEKGISVGGDDAGAALGRRMLGTLLTWMQERRSDVFLVATSNDITVLPPEFQRKGRFDEVFFVDLPTTEERAAIFAAQLALRRQDPATYAIPHLAHESADFSGAEIEQAVVAGILRALHAGRTPDTSAVLQEVRETVPLARSRPEAIAAVRARARDFVPASASASTGHAG